MQYSVSEIADFISGKVYSKSEKHFLCSEILTDSRKIVHPAQSVFFALKTARNNGHQFISELYAKGVQCFVVSENAEISSEIYKEAVFILCENTLEALQKFAAYHRNKFKIPVIAITGSNGKTITKEWLYSLLSAYMTIHRSPKSYNSQIGVPLSLLMLEEYHKVAIIEAGISMPGEMRNLEKMIHPDIGIFTCTGPAHDENFKTREEKISEKLKLFKHCKTLILNSDETELYRYIKKSYSEGVTLFTWGTQGRDSLRIKKTSYNSKSISLEVEWKTDTFQIEIPFADKASVQNAMNCFACLCVMGFSPDETALQMKNLHPVAMRLEMHNGINNCLIINDSYNSDLHSLTIALDFLTQQSAFRQSTVILSDMLETGIPAEQLYEEISQLMQKRNITKFIGIGPKIYENQSKFTALINKHFFISTDEFLLRTDLLNFSNEAILLKGARIHEFERINHFLQQRLHQTLLEINLNAVVHNLNIFKSLINKDTSIMAVVKAASYGSGSHEIASLLQYYKIQYLAVAYADEGIELRRNGIITPVMVMVPEYSAIESIITNRLEPEIYNFETLQWFSTDGNKPVTIHLKLDSGMHRLGFTKEETDLLIERLSSYRNIRVASIFTHLSSSENKLQDNFTKKQIEQYSMMYQKISESLGYKPLRHVLNSAGISRFPEFQFDMVRLGIGLYGVQPTQEMILPLQNVATLKTTIIQTRHIAKNERIGYGTDCITEKETDIAIIPIGYADGFRRILSNRKGKVLVNGHECPVLGNVCMDVTIIDISGTSAQVNDIAVLFGEDYSVEELAKNMNTIPYEVLTGISSRVKRKYIYE